MHKRKIVGISIMTIVVIIAMIVFATTSINSVNQKMTQYCFNELAKSSKELAKDLYKTANMDHTILTAMAAIIANEDDIDNKELCEIMRSYNTQASYATYVELLRPDNTMLDSNGTVRDVSSSFNFEKEAKKGDYISNIKRSTLERSQRVIRNAVPVKKNGDTIYMLYGVVRLSEFAMKYKTDVYDGHAYVYLEDGDTGSFC